MTDVFISYAREDRDQARTLATALGTLGWSVWWDRKIVTGQAFDRAIERELETAKSVVVLWSKYSTESEWVRNEAAVASERGVLVPATIEDVRPPLEFRRKQTADLVGWNGDPSHIGFQALCEGISATVGSAPQHPSTVHPDRRWWKRRWALAAIAVLLVASGLGIYYMQLRANKATPISRNHGIAAGASSQSTTINRPSAVAGPADLVVGSYSGDVIADSKGSSRAQVNLTVTKLDKWTVRVTSDYPRLGAVDVVLTRIGNKILNAGGDTTFLLDLEGPPPTLDYNPHGEVAYHGRKQPLP